MRSAARLGLVLLATAAAPGAAGAETARGEALYRSQCLVCHQPAGAGVKGQFPRLSGRVDAMARDPRGRTLLIDTLLNGMAGEIAVDGETIDGLMPPFRNLSDADLAVILDYVSGLAAGPRRPPAFTPTEIGARRGTRLSPARVGAQRRTFMAGAAR